MERGNKESHSPKQKRMARHIEEGYEKKGASKGKKAGTTTSRAKSSSKSKSRQTH